VNHHHGIVVVKAFTLTKTNRHGHKPLIQNGLVVVDSRGMISQQQQSSSQQRQPLNAAFVSDPEAASSSLRTRVKEFFLSYRRESDKPAVMEVDDVDILRYLLGRKTTTTTDEYTALIFHAPFCKACQASLPLFQRLARKYSRMQEKFRKRQRKSKYSPDHSPPPPVKFLSVAVTQANSKLLEEAFGITKYPMTRIYHPEQGLIDERPALKKLFKSFEDKLQSIVTSSSSSSTSSCSEASGEK
jgi:thiol-disulfide isomerase/thioredoxin